MNKGISTGNRMWTWKYAKQTGRTEIWPKVWSSVKAVGTFKPFKSAQTDEIVHMLLQRETDNLGCSHAGYLGAFLACRCIRTASRQVKVMWISEPG